MEFLEEVLHKQEKPSTYPSEIIKVILVDSGVLCTTNEGCVYFLKGPASKFNEELTIIGHLSSCTNPIN